LAASASSAAVVTIPAATSPGDERGAVECGVTVGVIGMTKRDSFGNDGDSKRL
jgi:hypothetical protein